MPGSADASGPRIATFRPADERIETARERIEAVGGVPVIDPMLSIQPTDALPRTDADFVVLTSKTGVDLIAQAGWTPDGMEVCAIGEPTADALTEAGFEVSLVPEEFSSSGLVAALQDHLPGSLVEVARSDHGSPVLLEGLMAAGAYVHETVLYRLERPPGAGESVDAAAAGTLDVVLFTSSLTVAHFMELAAETDRTDAVRSGLERAIVGVIGRPTRETAENHGIPVDVEASEATFDALLEESLAAYEANGR